MAIFVICDVANPSKMEAALRERFERDHYKLNDRTYLVSWDGTVGQLAERAGILKENDAVGVAGPAIVLRTTTYSGLANPEIWEWVATKLEKSRG